MAFVTGSKLLNLLLFFCTVVYHSPSANTRLAALSLSEILPIPRWWLLVLWIVFHLLHVLHQKSSFPFIDLDSDSFFVEGDIRQDFSLLLDLNLSLCLVGLLSLSVHVGAQCPSLPQLLHGWVSGERFDSLFVPTLSASNICCVREFNDIEVSPVDPQHWIPFGTACVSGFVTTGVQRLSLRSLLYWSERNVKIASRSRSLSSVLDCESAWDRWEHFLIYF